MGEKIYKTMNRTGGWSVAMGIVILVVYNIISYFKEKAEFFKLFGLFLLFLFSGLFVWAFCCS